MKEKKFSRTALFLVGCLFLLLVFKLSSVSAQQKSAFKIGVSVEMTGYAAWIGEAELRSFRLFVEQVNTKGGIDGHPLELIVYDGESNPEKSLNNAKKLVQRDKVAAILGPSIAACCNSVKPFIQEEKVVMWGYSGSFEPNYPDSFCFATQMDTAGYVEVIYEYLAKRGMNRVAILCATDSTGQIWLEEGTKAAKKYGFESASERFNTNDKDVTSQLIKLKAINPQALIVGVSGAPNAVVAKNFNQMGFKIPYITGIGNLSVSFLKLIEGIEPAILLLPGTYYIGWKELPDSYPQKKLMQEYTEAFEKKFNREADMEGVIAYDSIRVIAEAMKRVKPEGPQDSVNIRNELERIKNFPAVCGGTFNFSKENHRGLGKESALMIEVKGGKFVIAK